MVQKPWPYCFTSTEARLLIWDGDGGGGGGGGGGEVDERVKARPRIPPKKDRRDRGPPPEQWNKPVLNWANVCSPEHTSDTSTNYDSFLNWTFCAPNMVRTVQTLLHSHLACNEMQTSARSRQHDRKCRLKSSQYTLIIPHRVIQLTTISFWVSETRLCLPQVNK